jgi:hypothetical protein
MSRFNLDSRIADRPNHAEGLDPYGRPLRPEGSGRCWYCWAVLGNDPTTRGGREFCGPRHALAYHGRAGLAEIVEDELDAAYEEALDAVDDAEGVLAEAEAGLADAEAGLADAEDELRALEEKTRR